MADYRNIHTRIWADSWFCDLPTDEKLVFIYLFSNPSASVSGIYELPKRNIAMDTGLPITRIDQILASFSIAKKVHYENGIVWVVNLKKYNDSGDSAKIQTRIKKDIDDIPDSDIKTRYLAQFKTEEKKPEIPYPETEIPYPEKGSEREREREIETEMKEREKGEEPLSPPPDEPEGDSLPGNPLSVAFEQAAKIQMHNPPKWVEALDEMTRLGVQPVDIETAVKELTEKQYSVVGPWSIKNAAISCMGKRKNNGNAGKASPSGRQRGRRLVQ